MDDFSTPGQSNYYGYAPSKANFIEPGKRPMSSASPTIIFNPNDPLVIKNDKIISKIYSTIVKR